MGVSAGVVLFGVDDFDPAFELALELAGDDLTAPAAAFLVFVASLAPLGAAVVFVGAADLLAGAAFFTSVRGVGATLAVGAAFPIGGLLAPDPAFFTAFGAAKDFSLHIGCWKMSTVFSLSRPSNTFDWGRASGEQDAGDFLCG